MLPDQAASANLTRAGELLSTTEAASDSGVRRVDGRRLVAGEEHEVLFGSLGDSLTKLRADCEARSLEFVQNASPKLMSLDPESTQAPGQIPETMALVDKNESLETSVDVTAEKFIELMRSNKFAADTNYVVDSDLDLTGLQNVILPPSLHIKGDFRIGRKSVSELPEILFGNDIQTAKRDQDLIPTYHSGSDNAGFRADVPDDTDIGHLPDNLVIDGKFIALKCSKWLGFGNKTLIMKRCEIAGCEGFESFGKQFEVADGGLTVCRCPRLKTLPEIFLVRSRVTFDKTGLIGIPESMKFDGALDVVDCHDFKYIGSGVSVGRVIIKNCENFEQWPADIQVQKSIGLTGLHGVMIFPESLKLDGDFYLSDISVKLPHDLNIGGNLIMLSTKILNSDDIVQVKVRFCIDLTDTPMEEVPSWLNNCFDTDSQLPHHVFLVGTGLTRAESELEDSDRVFFHF